MYMLMFRAARWDVILTSFKICFFCLFVLFVSGKMAKRPDPCKMKISITIWGEILNNNKLDITALRTIFSRELKDQLL